MPSKVCIACIHDSFSPDRAFCYGLALGMSQLDYKLCADHQTLTAQRLAALMLPKLKKITQAQARADERLISAITEIVESRPKSTRCSKK